MSKTRSIRLKRWIAVMLAVLTLGSLIPSVFAETYSGTTNAKVILRKSASKDSTPLQTVRAGESVTILTTSGDWYQVKYCGITGYMMKQYVTTSVKVPLSTSDQIRALGTAPGIVRAGDRNSDVTKLQKALIILGYLEGKADGIYGDDTVQAVQKYQSAHKLTADGVAGTKTVTSIFGSCNQKSLSTQEWAEEATTVKNSTVKTITEIGDAPGTSKLGDKGLNVTKLQQALQILGFYTGKIDGIYGKTTMEAVKKFQTKRGMKADGIAGKVTITVIFGKVGTSTGSSNSGSSSKSYQTEVLDWFKDNVSSVIPKKAHFIVKDVATGRTFSCARWSGVNHLDAEPLTSNDTATMKAIYGGSWSWRRRAVLVLYNGHVYAASMNGMPHGTSTISGNNFAGHFCIHFKNSKTHGTKKVDASHQDCVTRASKAKW